MTVDVLIPAAASTVLLWASYEFQDELFDDDNENSLIDNVAVLGGILLVTFGVLIWSVT